MDNSIRDGLSSYAKRRACLYGTAIHTRAFNDPQLLRAMSAEVAALVPESELKWRVVHPRPDVFDFRAYRRLAAFAQQNRMEMRGHTLVWHEANPAWLKHTLNKTNAEKTLTTHIQRVMQETAPLIRNWDVVNEAVHPLSQQPDHLRPSLWLDALGENYIPLAFHAAHEAGPEVTLTYNDYGCEYADGNGIVRRKSVLNLLQKLKRDGVPVHALGLQSHLIAGRPLGGDAFLSFLSDVRGMGLKIFITELDMDVSKLPGRMNEKINSAQHYLRTYLDMVHDGGEVEMLFTWGLSDRSSWLRTYMPHLAGMLPLDDRLQHGAMWETLKEFWG